METLFVHADDGILCADEMSSVQKARAGCTRVVPTNLLDSGDLECSLCMR